MIGADFTILKFYLILTSIHALEIIYQRVEDEILQRRPQEEIPQRTYAQALEGMNATDSYKESTADKGVDQEENEASHQGSLIQLVKS